MTTSIPELDLRPAVVSDIEDIFRLSKEFLELLQWKPDLTFDDKRLREDIFSGQDSIRYWVAEKTNEDQTKEVIAYALYVNVYSTWGGKGIFLEELYVTANYRRCGVGKTLLKACCQADPSFNRLELTILIWNEVSKRFYESLGAFNFTETKGGNVYILEGPKFKTFLQ